VLIRQFHVVIIATKVAFSNLPSPPFRSEPVGNDRHGVPLFPLVWVANATLALAESGVCKRQAPSQGREKQRGVRAPLRAKPRLSLWVEGA